MRMVFQPCDKTMSNNQQNQWGGERCLSFFGVKLEKISQDVAMWLGVWASQGVSSECSSPRADGLANLILLFLKHVYWTTRTMLFIFALGIQFHSPKRRMGAWKLNTLRFGGDCTPQSSFDVR